MKYYISILTYILYVADIALQAVYKIIAFAIPIHHSIEGMCCTMPGYIAIIADSCTLLRSFGSISLELWFLFALGDLSFNQNDFDVFELLECDDYRHAFMYWFWYTFQAYVGWDEVWMEYLDRATYGCIKLYKEDEVDRVRCTYIHVLMHVHIIIEIWDCKRSDWDSHRGNTRSYILCVTIKCVCSRCRK